jgi:hypothetical protein
MKVQIDDRFGKTVVNFSKVTGWRKELAEKFFVLDSQDWTDDAARVYIALEALKGTKSRREAVHFMNVVKAMTKLEIHFWASKLLSNERAARAWRVMYG